MIPPLHSLRALRVFLDYRQRQMADLLEISLDTYKALELGRRPLTGKMAARIAVKTGVDYEWLTRNQPGEEIRWESGQPSTAVEIEKAQRKAQFKLAHNFHLLRHERTELAQALFLLCVISDDYGADVAGKVQFKKRLERFLQAEEEKRPELHQKLTAYRREHFPGKSFLYLRDPRVLDTLIKDLQANKLAWKLYAEARKRGR
jgi:transcriptional regulator with XRE-family HTH domain